MHCSKLDKLHVSDPPTPPLQRQIRPLTHDLQRPSTACDIMGQHTCPHRRVWLTSRLHRARQKGLPRMGIKRQERGVLGWIFHAFGHERALWLRARIRTVHARTVSTRNMAWRKEIDLTDADMGVAGTGGMIGMWGGRRFSMAQTDCLKQ
jgi:hypothetical protein